MRIQIKASGEKASKLYNYLSGEFEETNLDYKEPKIIVQQPGIKKIYIPKEINENPYVIIYADLASWEVWTNIDEWKKKALEIEGKKAIDFADWLCPYLGQCPYMENCQAPFLKPEALRMCPITGKTFDELVEEIGVDNKEIYLIKEQVK